jgi:hypothetical protein
MDRACITYRENKNAYRILVGKPEGKRPLGRPGGKGEDTTKMNLREIEWGDMGWINLAQDREQQRTLANAVLNLRVP